MGSGQCESQPEGPRGRTPHPWGGRERVGSRDCLGISAGKLLWKQTLWLGKEGRPGAMSGVCDIAHTPRDCQNHSFPILPSFLGRSNVSCLWAPCMAVVHTSDSCLHIRDSCRGPSWPLQCARHWTVSSLSPAAWMPKKHQRMQGYDDLPRPQGAGGRAGWVELLWVLSEVHTLPQGVPSALPRRMPEMTVPQRCPSESGGHPRRF